MGEAGGAAGEEDRIDLIGREPRLFQAHPDATGHPLGERCGVGLKATAVEFGDQPASTSLRSRRAAPSSASAILAPSVAMASVWPR